MKSFELRIVSNTPLVGEKDPDNVARTFLEQIGYLSRGSDPSLPYKLFVDFFLRYPEKAWLVDDMAAQLSTSRPTVYRHLNKLKSFDILEEVSIYDETTHQNKKAYRLRYGDLQKAWSFVEAHIKVAVENYTRTVQHLQQLLDEERKEQQHEQQQ